MYNYYIYDQSKNTNAQSIGELAPLAVPDGQFDFWTLDFIIGLPINGLFNAVMVCIDKLFKLVRLVPY